VGPSREARFGTAERRPKLTACGIDADGVRPQVNHDADRERNGVTIRNQKIDDTATGGGADTVKNFGAIAVNASAESDTAAVAGTTKGLSVAFGQSTAEATAAAIRGGAATTRLRTQRSSMPPPAPSRAR
jgi:hypothetical protein